MGYNNEVGRRLRSIRRQRGFSLLDVQRLSEGEFKAAVLGAYERGERSLSMPRLHRLAKFFGVPVRQMLPQDEATGASLRPRESGGLTINLSRLDSMSRSHVIFVERFLGAIQVMRQDFNGKVLTIRGDDLRMLAILLDLPEDAFASRLLELGVAGEAGFGERGHRMNHQTPDTATTT
jgi:transcriptional regulator with XRE-family HTH domain